MSLSIFDIYDKNGQNYKQFFYNTSDFFINNNGILCQCKNNSGSIILRKSNQNKLNCNTENHQSFIKTIIPEAEFNFKKAKLSQFAGISIRNLLLPIIVELGKSFGIKSDKVIKPLSHLYKEKFAENKFYNTSNYKDMESSEEQAFILLKDGLMTKIPFLKNILETRLNKLLTWKKYYKEDYKKPYELLYLIHSLIEDLDKPQITYNKKNSLVKIEDILYRTSIKNLSFQQYQKILSSYYKDNENIIRNTKFQDKDFSIVCKWDYVRKFSTYKSKILKEFNLIYCNKRKNIYAPLNKTILEENKILAFTCKDINEIKSLKNNLNLDIEYIYYDKLEKEYIFFIQYSRDPYPGYLRLISNTLKSLGFKTINCESLYNQTTYGKSIAFLLNKDVSLLNMTKNFQPEKKERNLLINFNGEDIDTGKINTKLEWLINPYGQKKPSIFNNVEIPFTYYDSNLEGKNTFYKKAKKYNVTINDMGEFQYQEIKDIKNIIFKSFTNYKNAKGLGNLINSKNNVLENINKRLRKSGKKQLHFKESNYKNILDLYIGNIVLYLIEKTVYGYNVFKKDTNQLRSSYQELCIESNVRYKIFNKSISQYLQYLDLNKFKNEKEILEYLRPIASYEIFLQTYKAICEDFFELTPIVLPTKKTSINGICLSYKFNLSKMIKIINSIGKRVKINFELNQNKPDKWEEDFLKKINTEDMEFYKEALNTHNFQIFGEKSWLVLRNIYKVTVQWIFNFIDNQLQDLIKTLKFNAENAKESFEEYIINRFGKEDFIKRFKDNLDYL